MYRKKKMSVTPSIIFARSLNVCFSSFAAVSLVKPSGAAASISTSLDTPPPLYRTTYLIALHLRSNIRRARNLSTAARRRRRGYRPQAALNYSRRGAVRLAEATPVDANAAVARARQHVELIFELVMAERPAMKKHDRLASCRVDVLHVELYPRLYLYVVSGRRCLRESKSFPIGYALSART